MEHAGALTALQAKISPAFHVLDHHDFHMNLKRGSVYIDISVLMANDRNSVNLSGLDVVTAL
jgi:hypothetical protein